MQLGRTLGRFLFLGVLVVLPGAAHAEHSPSRASAPATQRVDDPAFQLELRPRGRYRLGREGSAEVLLEPRGDFKVNDKYPFRFEYAAYKGIRPSEPVVSREAMELSKKQLLMTLRFTPESKNGVLAGDFKFSLCTSDRCLVKREHLELPVRAD